MEVASAKVYKYDAGAHNAPESYCEEGKKQENIDIVWDTFRKGKAQLQEMHRQLSLESETQAGIIEAHIRILEDEELMSKVLSAVELDGATAEYAIEKVFDAYIDFFGKAEEVVLKDKIFDLKDMKEYLLRILRGASKQELADIKEEVILIAKELLPSEVLLLNPNYVKGIITEKGNPWSHAAILAKARQIPMQTGVEGIWDKVQDGDLLPMVQTIEEQYNAAEVVLKNGRRIEIGININGPEWELSGECYDYVGLYRTEFQYMENDQLPTEEELFEAYKKTVIRACGKRVTFRTIDIGADKIPEYMSESKGYVNVERGVRFCFHNSEIFLTQLRAILRASVYGPVQIMFPMIESVEDILKSKDFVKKAMKQLEETGENYDRDIAIGIMIEIYEIAKQADKVAGLVDFASVGTNDLMESISGARYSEASLAQLYGLLGAVFSVFEQAGKPISVCGALAGDPDGAMELVRFGAKRLSMHPAEVSKVKSVLMRLEI